MSGFNLNPGKNVNKVFEHRDGQVYLAIGYVDQPAMLLVNVKTGAKRTEVINCLNAKHYEEVSEETAAYWRGFMEGLRIAKECA